MAIPTAVSFARIRQADDDFFTSASTGLTEDNLGLVALDVMGNDLGGVAKKLYSLDDGTNSPNDLLTRDDARSGSASADRSAHGATIWITADGKVAYDASTLYADFKSELQRLAPGESLTDSFAYAIQLGNGALSWSMATVQLAGVNDAPVIVSAAQAGFVQEDVTLGASGQVSATDVDHGDAQHYSVAGSSAGAYGSLALEAATGQWTYTLDNGAPAVQALGANESHAESFVVRVTDNYGAFAEQSVNVTVQGTNDGPVITSAAQTGTVREDIALSTMGRVTASDVDNADHQHYAVVDGAGTYGSLSVDANTGAWVYTLRNGAGNVQALAEGEHHDETFVVYVTDDAGAAAEQRVVVSVSGSNDGPVAVADSVAGMANQLLTIDVLGNDLDVDHGHVLSVVSATALADQGSVTIVDNQLVYDPRSAFAGLAQGQVAHATLAYTMQDEHGAQSTSTVDVELTGVAQINHAPVISGDSAGAVYEDGPRAASGQLLGIDQDPGSILTWSLDSATGTYGSLSFDNGRWSYSLSNSAAIVQALRQGERVADSFTLHLTDERGASATQQIAVAVTGTDDSPGTPSGPASGFVSAQAPTATARLGVSDVDHDAAHTWSLSRSPTGYSSDYRYALDDLSIVKNANPYFHDGFDNTLLPGPAPAAPNFADGAAASYQGPGRYSEQGGNLILDGALAGASNGVGVSRLIVGQPLQLNSNINPADLAHGLKATDSFTVTASYSVGNDTNGPGDLWQSFGVTLSDRTIGGLQPDQLGNDLLSLRAVSDLSGRVNLQFAQYNVVTDTVTVLQTIAVHPENLPNPDHAVFRLTHDASNPGVVHASTDVMSGGSVVATYNFDQVGHIFSDENWTRVQLAAFGADEGGSQIAGTYGTLSVDDTGQWTYRLDTASPAYQALTQPAVDNFAVRAIDEYGLSAFRPVSISIAPPNHAPVAISEAFSTPHDTPLTIPIATLLANDRDPDGDPLSFQITPSPGVAQVGSDIVFTPEPGSAGPSGFNYGISDGRGGFANGYVSITVDPGPASLAPVVHLPGEQVAAPERSFFFDAADGNRITISDADSSVLTVTLFADASNIAFGTTADVTVTSSPNGGFNNQITGTPDAINAALNGLTITPWDQVNSTRLSLEVTDGSFHTVDTLALMRTSGPVDTSIIEVSDGSLDLLTRGVNGHMGDAFHPIVGLRYFPDHNLYLTISSNGNFVQIFNSAPPDASFGETALGWYYVPTVPVADFSVSIEVTDFDRGENVSAVIPVHVGDVAPLITAPLQQSVPAARFLEFNTTHGNAISIHDPDGDSLSVSLRSFGVLHVAPGSGAEIVAAGGGIDIRGSEAQVNAALATLTYAWGGVFHADSIQIGVSDGGLRVGSTIPIWVADPVPELAFSTPNPASPTQISLRVGALPAGDPIAIQWGDSGGQEAQVSNGTFLDFSHAYAPGLVSTLSLIPSHGALVQYRVQVAATHSSALTGTLGDDLLIGSNFDDTLTGTAGSDILVGGLGADRFVYHAAGGGNDTITDFNAGQGDALDIRDVLAGYNPSTSSLADFVRLDQSGGNSVVSVDADGPANGSNFVPLATLQGVSGLLLEDLVASGNVLLS